MQAPFSSDKQADDTITSNDVEEMSKLALRLLRS